MLALTKNGKIIRGDMPGLCASQLQAVVIFPCDVGFVNNELDTKKRTAFLDYIQHVICCRFYPRDGKYESESLFFDFMRNISKKMKEQIMMNQPISEIKIESEIEQSAPAAPKLTPEFIDLKIKKVEYLRPTERMTLCILTLENGAEVTGESFCACPENYVQKTGEGVAYKNAKDKIWSLEGYLLRERLYGSKNPALDELLNALNEHRLNNLENV